MTRKDVQEVVLGPMLDVYMPGQHIRHDHHAQHRALNQYVMALEKYDRPTLERAWSIVRDTHELVVWPTPQQFVEAAKSIQPNVLGEETLKRQRAEAMKDSKLREYAKNSKLFKQAEREGWGTPLLQYVEEQLWIQSQVLAGCRGVGFEAHLLGTDTKVSSAQEAFDQIRDWLGDRFATERKLIVKPPPAKLLQRWKESAKHEVVEHQR